MCIVEVNSAKSAAVSQFDIPPGIPGAEGRAFPRSAEAKLRH